MMKAALMRAGAKVKLFSTRIGELRGATGGTLMVDDLLVTIPSVVFDAVFVPGGANSVAILKSSGDAIHCMREAYKHAKAISALDKGGDFLVAVGVIPTPMPASKVAGVSVAAALLPQHSPLTSSTTSQCIATGCGRTRTACPA